MADPACRLPPIREASRSSADGASSASTRSSAGSTASKGSCDAAARSRSPVVDHLREPLRLHNFALLQEQVPHVPFVLLEKVLRVINNAFTALADIDPAATTRIPKVTAHALLALADAAHKGDDAAGVQYVATDKFVGDAAAFQAFARKTFRSITADCRRTAQARFHRIHAFAGIDPDTLQDGIRDAQPPFDRLLRALALTHAADSQSSAVQRVIHDINAADPATILAIIIYAEQFAEVKVEMKELHAFNIAKIAQNAAQDADVRAQKPPRTLFLSQYKPH